MLYSMDNQFKETSKLDTISTKKKIDVRESWVEHTFF